jgi:hypothetical protein
MSLRNMTTRKALVASAIVLPVLSLGIWAGQSVAASRLAPLSPTVDESTTAVLASDTTVSNSTTGRPPTRPPVRPPSRSPIVP